MKKTIWCISKYASPPQYGVGSRLFYMAKEFSERNHVTLISSNSNHLAQYPESNHEINEEFYGSLKHIWLKTYQYGISSSAKRFLSWLNFDRRLYKYLKQSNEVPEIVIISSLSLTSIRFGLYLKKKFGTKLIFEVRDIYPLTMTLELGFNRLNPLILYFSYLEKLGYKKADLIVGTMPNLNEHVKNRVKHHSKVIHSPIGIPQTWDGPNLENQTIEEIFPKSDYMIVGYAGSLGKSNAMDAFFEAIQKTKPTDGIRFYIVGSGELKDYYHDLTKNLMHVIWGPRLSQSEIPAFLNRCDLLYLAAFKDGTTKYGQSFNKMVDYMMAAKPVIASYSGYPSMLNEADAGVFIPAEDSEILFSTLMKFKEMPSIEKEMMGLRGRKWILEYFNYPVVAENYLTEINNLF